MVDNNLINSDVILLIAFIGAVIYYYIKYWKGK